MEIMDIFDDDAFSMVTMTAAINKTPYMPNFLGSLGIFTPTPIRTIDAAMVINDDGILTVVQTTPRGAPPIEQKVTAQNIRSFRTPRIAVGDTIYASELQGILARSALIGPDFTTMMADMQSEMAWRLDGPVGLQSKQEATKERMRLGAISGIVLDADGTVLYDWPTLFGQTLPTEIGFNLQAVAGTGAGQVPPGTLLTTISQLKRSILRAARAGNLVSANVIGLAGDEFYDALRQHPDVSRTYLNWMDAVNLRESQPFEMFPFGGINFYNYRGSDDNETIAIAVDKVKFIVTGVPGLFQEVLAPAETFDYINTPGLPIYTMVIPDRDRNQFVRLETYSYPMYVAGRPEMLFSGRMEE
jgi:hypothetical protein